MEFMLTCAILMTRDNKGVLVMILGGGMVDLACASVLLSRGASSSHHPSAMHRVLVRVCTRGERAWECGRGRGGRVRAGGRVDVWMCGLVFVYS